MNNMKTIRDFDVENKRVLVRCDFNIPLNGTRILDDFRIKKVIPTIEYLTKRKAKVILISHLGRPESGKKDIKLSLRPVAERLGLLLKKKVMFFNDCIGEEISRQTTKIKPGEVVLLENLRFYREEKEASLSFAAELAKLGDIFIQDAFGVSHRAHASVIGIPKHLPAGIGFLLEEEINILTNIMKSPERPLVAIIGGAKIKTKIRIIERFLKEADSLLLGGKVANAVLIAKGISVGKSTPEDEIIRMAAELDLTNDKLHLPTDIIAVNNSYRKTICEDIREDEMALDIGSATIDSYSEIIAQAKTIIWNGPLGKIEDEKCSQGTIKIIKAILKSSAFSVVGGGETVKMINRLGLTEKFDYISTGGGGMLKFLGNEELPGIEAIK